MKSGANSRVVDFRAYRAARVKNLHTRQKAADRHQPGNQLLAERMVERWGDGEGAGAELLRAMLNRAVKDRSATPERTAALLVTVLDIIDERQGTLNRGT